jgi:hypothetical protein
MRAVLKGSCRWSLLITLAAMLFISGLCLIPSQGPGITRANFGVIQAGMTTDEVDAILGGGPDLAEGGATRVDARWIEVGGSTIVVTFNGEGKVTGKQFIESKAPVWRRIREFIRQRMCYPISGCTLTKRPSDDWWLQWCDLASPDSGPSNETRSLD